VVPEEFEKNIAARSSGLELLHLCIEELRGCCALNGGPVSINASRAQ
jgi:hypothetical protein